MLRVEGVTIDHGRGVVVAGVDFTVAPGEIVALLGASGSGKSSVLRVVSGLATPAAGSIHWNDDALDRVPPHRRGIGMVFQGQALFPHLDVAGNVAFGLDAGARRRGAGEPRVGELLDLVGLAGYAERRVASLSGGEQQRVALARALAPRPRALLLDEPFSALDRALRERLVGEVESIVRAAGVATVLVTHDQDEAFAVADRIAVLADGTVAQYATPTAVWSRPATPSVAALLGFGAPVSGVVSGAEVRTPWGVVPRPDGIADGACSVVLRPDALRLVDTTTPAVPSGPGVLVAEVVRVVPGRGRLGAVLKLVDGTRRTVDVATPVRGAVQLLVRPEAVLVYPH